MTEAQALKEQYESPEFRDRYFYDGNDLGAVCTGEGTVFSLWCPLAKSVSLLLYRDGSDSQRFARVPMHPEECGVWRYRTSEYLHGYYYHFQINNGSGTVITPDPYARAGGVNGRRSMVVDLSRTNPDGWDEDRAPEKAADDIIYELHVREFSWQPAGGFPPSVRGKYRAFACADTTLNHDGVHPTGLSYLKKLGVTTVELMPIVSFGGVDETDPAAFSWGYDPISFLVPSGAYSTDPAHGETAVRECKEMIQALHRSGFRVIMDVVCGHTCHPDSSLNRAVPWYYYRTDASGKLTNGSRCGNDIASEAPMCSRFILDSLLYWAGEYHIDGFRFDQMGLMDVELLNRIRRELDRIYGQGEKVLIGEPWAADDSAIAPGLVTALKVNLPLLDPGIGMFCDDTRDAIKGHVFFPEAPGFVNGAQSMEESVLRSAQAWCVGDTGVKAPSQIVNYVSSHDNQTLWDRLKATIFDGETCLRANRLAAAIIMTSQGRPFLLSGEEFARTKNGGSSTGSASVELNQLDWKRAWENEALVNYYRGLIALRKQCPGLCDKSAHAGERFYLTWTREGSLGFCLHNEGGDCPWKSLMVVYHVEKKPLDLKLPAGEWEILADGEDSFRWQSPETVSDRCPVAPLSALILGQR